MKYFIFRNGNQVTAVSHQQLVSVPSDTDDALKLAALSLANDRFACGGSVDPAATQCLDVYDPETDSADDLPLPEGTIVQLAKELHGNDNLDIDPDAEISGLNVQCWRYLDPESALEHLATGDPMPAERSEPNRRHAAEGPYRALRPLADLLVREVQAQCAAAGMPVAARIQEIIGLINGLAPQPDRRNVVVSVPIQSWEIRERSDQDLNDAQRRPWRLEVELQGDQLLVAVWPEGEERKAAQEGLGLFVEVNRGQPAVHVAPAPDSDNVVHLHAVAPGIVEVSPGSASLPAPGVGSVYPGPALRFELQG